ncbi:MAG: sulfite exporter TauE/SafE family protein [Alphaproteobacteria bacterium]|nr:sulfite exporter TauE/SafE family protein [Alphaproteobacteria bacterium]MDD9919616.1 sulfite exporter TauE/SafE family protein [Alphaproteobacteria bacterium]
MFFAEVDLTVWAYVAAFVVVFLAQMYGAVASGDGLIIQPILVALGVPANAAMANDTTGSAFAGFSSAWVYYKNGLLSFNTLLWWAPGIILGPIAGAILLAYLPLIALDILIVASSIAGAAYFLLRRKSKTQTSKVGTSINRLCSVIFGFIVGFLTGLGLGGVGIITKMLLIASGLDIKRASAISSVIGTVPIFPAFFAYLVAGLISPLLLLVISVAFATGSYVGSHIVIRMDTALLERIFMVSTILISIFILAMKFIG